MMTRLSWFEIFLAVFLFGLGILFVCSLHGCGGSPNEALFTPSFGNSPVADGGLSEDSLAGSDGARSPGLDAAATGEFRGEAGDPMESSDVADSAPLDSHLSDPWPADVVVERMPAPNCFVAWTGDTTCCFAQNVPPVLCEAQNQPHYCAQCPR